MIARIARIRRHPIKSAGGEDLDRVGLHPARPLPGDREWAVLTEAGEAHVGPGAPDRWLPKGCFLRGAASASLQAVQGGWCDGALQLRHPDHPPISADPQTQGERLVDWLAQMWPQDKPAPSRIVRAPTAFTDVRWPWISILSLDSLRALESQMGRPLGIERWRGNLWVEGWAPWAERGLPGQILRIGEVELRVTQTIGRCAATSADPATGTIDLDMPEALQRLYGNSDFGIYAEVASGGEIALNDEVRA